MSIKEDSLKELEIYEIFFKYFKKRETCLYYGRAHGGDSDRCEKRGENFRADWMNKKMY